MTSGGTYDDGDDKGDARPYCGGKEEDEEEDEEEGKGNEDWWNSTTAIQCALIGVPVGPTTDGRWWGSGASCHGHVGGGEGWRGGVLLRPVLHAASPPRYQKDANGHKCGERSGEGYAKEEEEEEEDGPGERRAGEASRPLSSGSGGQTWTRAMSVRFMTPPRGDRGGGGGAAVEACREVRTSSCSSSRLPEGVPLPRRVP